MAACDLYLDGENSTDNGNFFNMVEKIPLKALFLKFWWKESFMNEIIEEMKRCSKKLDSLLSLSLNAKKIRGSLVVKNKGDRLEFYRYIDQASLLEYLGSNKTDILASLAQKRYDTQLLNAVNKQKKAVDFCIKKLEEAGMEDLSKIYNGFPAELKQYIKPRLDDDEQYAAKWQAKNYAKSRKKNETDNYTIKGEHVRSKSEIIIADRLHAKGIPYHYEPIFLIDENDYLVPDFIILNKRTHREFLWEHFGLMENPQYCLVALSKIETYAREGYILGKNLICTFESKNHPLNLKYVDMLIEEYLK